MKKLSPIVKMIQTEMDRQNLNATELGAMAGVHFSAIYRILKGDQVPSVETACLLLGAMKLKLEAVKK